MADAEWSATIVDKQWYKSSVIDSKAKISKNVKIGPFCYVGPKVQLEDSVELISNVHIEGDTKIGKGTKIFPFASIGTSPQDLKYKGEDTKLVIGKNNTIREYVTINLGTESGGGITKVGDGCLFMISSHVAHDCVVGNNVLIANNVPLGGHVIIEDEAIIGGNSAVQQFTRIGKLAMVGGMTGVLNDVIPYGLSIGNRNYLKGLNLIGLKRAFLKTTIHSTHHEGQANMKYHRENVLELSKAYHEIFATKILMKI